jgi:hypothetical protein
MKKQGGKQRWSDKIGAYCVLDTPLKNLLGGYKKHERMMRDC